MFIDNETTSLLQKIEELTTDFIQDLGFDNEMME